MTDTLVLLGSLSALLAALVHLGIFFLESVFWTRPWVWRMFGVTSQENAEVIRPMAYNQGFYNVFLALGAGAGLVMIGSSNLVQGGIAITVFALTSMTLASLVLLGSSPRLWRAALVQGAPALLGAVLLGVALLG